MRVGGHISIRGKLSLSALAALTLVVTMAMLAWQGFEGIGRRNAGDEAAQKLAGEVESALIAVLRMPDLGRALAGAQSQDIAEQQAASLKALSEIANAHLDTAAALAGSEMRPQIAAARQTVDAYYASIGELQSMRQQLLKLRDSNFEDDYNQLTVTLDPLRQWLTRVQGGTAFVQALDTLAEQLANARLETMLFLATGRADRGRQAMELVSMAEGSLRLARAMARNDEARKWIDGVDERLIPLATTLRRLLAIAQDLGQIWDQRIDPDREQAQIVLQKLNKQMMESVAASRAVTTGVIGAETQRLEWICGVIVAVLLGSSWLTARTVARPIGQMTSVLLHMKDGDYDLTVPARDRHDEIGDMANAIEVLREAGLERRRLREDQERARAEAETERKRMLDTVARSFEDQVRQVVESVAESAIEMEGRAQTMAALSEQTKSDTANVAAATDQASTNVQTVASAAEQLSASISEIGRQVERSVGIANRAVGETKRSSDEVAALETAAHRIGDIVRLVTEIAEQTNLLALNATIEAARAGEAGRGFAVVAAEVKTLAGQTAKATDDIAAQVEAIQRATQSTVQTLKGVTGTIEAMSSISTSVAASVEQQQAATSEIARNVQHAAVGTNVVARAISEVRTATDRTSDATTQMLARTRDLNRISDRLKSAADHFVRQLRSA